MSRTKAHTIKKEVQYWKWFEWKVLFDFALNICVCTRMWDCVCMCVFVCVCVCVCVCVRMFTYSCVPVHLYACLLFQPFRRLTAYWHHREHACTRTQTHAHTHTHAICKHMCTWTWTFCCVRIPPLRIAAPSQPLLFWLRWSTCPSNPLHLIPVNEGCKSCPSCVHLLSSWLACELRRCWGRTRHAPIESVRHRRCQALSYSPVH